jgi:arginase
MQQSHLNILFPQWQGGGPDLSTYEGAQELKDLYFRDIALSEVDVSAAPVNEIQNNIFGYTALLDQLSRAKAQIAAKQPTSVFTVGGGCDADFTPIAYLNEMTQGQITVLYFDAHGDLNTPESSGSKHFYGMPLRALLGNGDPKIIDLIPRKLTPSQVMILGLRDLDPAEEDYINEHNIRTLTVDDMEQDIEGIIRAVRAKGNQTIYVHVDLDVLDSDEFPYMPLYVPGGLKSNTLLAILRRLNEEFRIAGLGLFEYSPSDRKDNELIREIIQMGCGL